jgi:myo-inositol 2-dehydrogenase/D-chiro-inositol 1-dehydrogenase
MKNSETMGNAGTRRDFIKGSAATVAALSTIGTVASAAGPDKIRVGLVGCGRRGSGAVLNCIESSENVELVAVGDMFQDKIDWTMGRLEKVKESVKVSRDSVFTGFDAYQQVIDSDLDLLILATPPAFRPDHLDAAVRAGKHVFMEKPAAVDPVGIRSVIASGELAKKKGLAIVAGTQRRHQAEYLATMKRVHDGAIGDIVSAECYWVDDYEYYTPPKREKGWSEMEWQLRNWNYYTWLSGDHIVEQHVHNIDIMNWALGSHPISALGMGGRQQRTGSEFGHIYDHFAVELEYPGGVRVTSLCRQMEKVAGRIGEYVVGTKGTCDPAREIKGAKPFMIEEEGVSPYVQEHTDLIASIRAGKPLNEARTIAR